MKKILIAFIGIALAVGVIATGTYGLSEKNIDIYKQAVEIQDGRDNFGFENFAFTDYPVAFYDGDKEYVLTWDKDGYDITKRRPVLNAIAATAYPVDGHYEVLAPTVEKMSSLLGVMSAGEAGYGEQEQAATIWHEAFHCYQLANFLSNIESICNTDVDESIIAEYADTNDKAVELFKEQAELLEKAVGCEDIDKIREYIVKYKQLDNERKALLTEDIISIEDYYTRVEGSACYIEACVYRALLPDKFEESYIDGLSEYSGGSAKYYRTGMAECMILDSLDPNWKDGFDFSESAIDIIYEKLGI